MKNCKLNADKKVCDNLEEKQFSFFFIVLWNFRYWIIFVTDSDNCLEQIFYLQTLLKTNNKKTNSINLSGHHNAEVI